MSDAQGERGASEAGAIPAPGALIAGKYQVERVLGAGGMGVVLSARHLQLGQRVAVKFMREQVATDPCAVSRFLREAQAAAALSSEHATKVLDFGTLESGLPYMVMEFLAGVDLGAVLHESGPFAVRDAVGAVLQACEALAEAHALGIVHRDLKPANLFVTRRIDGSSLVKVLDFGISKLVAFNTAGAEGEDLTASGSIVGSPGYMSPEQIRNSKAADARSDIWSLGVIVYELLTGENPFSGETIGETFAHIVSEDPAPIQSLRSDVPAGLAQAVGRCLERTVARRIQTIDDLAAEIAPFGPADARGAVDRIRRISMSAGAARGPVPDLVAGPATVVAPSTGFATGPAAWLRSAASHPRRGATAKRKWIALAAGPAIAVPAIVLAIGVAGRANRAVALRARSGVQGLGRGDVGPSSAVVAGPKQEGQGARAVAAPSRTGSGRAEIGVELPGPASGEPGPGTLSLEATAGTRDDSSEPKDKSRPTGGASGRALGSRHGGGVERPAWQASGARPPPRIPAKMGPDAGSAHARRAVDATPKESPYDDL